MMMPCGETERETWHSAALARATNTRRARDNNGIAMARVLREVPAMSTSSDPLLPFRKIAADAKEIATDLPAMVSLLVRRAARESLDPWLFIGVLIESIAYVIKCSVPEKKRRECADAAVQLLRDRLGV